MSEIEILEEMAAIHAVLGDSLRAIETYEALAGRAAHHGLIDVEVRALIDMAWPLSWIDPQRSLDVLEQAFRLSARLEDPLLRARMRTRCFAWRLWQGWNPQDMEEFHRASAEIFKSDDRRKLAPYLVDCGFISCLSSEYREAYRNLMESRAIKLEAAEENPYLSPAYVRGQLPLTLSLLFVGEWGEALREIKDAIAMLDKNGDYNWGQGVRPHLAWIHLQAMDFSGVLALCSSALPLAGDPEPGTAPDYTAPYRFGLWKRLFLMGAAETALGNYESALEHLLAARADMDRPGPHAPGTGAYRLKTLSRNSGWRKATWLKRGCRQRGLWRLRSRVRNVCGRRWHGKRMPASRWPNLTFRARGIRSPRPCRPWKVSKCRWRPGAFMPPPSNLPQLSRSRLGGAPPGAQPRDDFEAGEFPAGGRAPSRDISLGADGSQDLRLR